jgi:hypothetical protein
MVGVCAGTRGGRGVRATAGGEEEEEEVDEAIEVLLGLLDPTGLLNDDANAYRENIYIYIFRALVYLLQSPGIFTTSSRSLYSDPFQMLFPLPIAFYCILLHSIAFYCILLHCQS